MCGIGTDWLKEAAAHAQPMAAPALLNNKRALIIFVKNPVLGKVKTRLAKTIGDQAALEAYQMMLENAHEVALTIDCARWVYYAEYLGQDDLWEDAFFHKAVQGQGDVGERMAKAFEELFVKGYQEVLLVGSDILDLQPQHLNQAFKVLQQKDFVLGPALDGGYYLVGMKQFDGSIFIDKTWSHDQVLSSTLKDIQQQDKTYGLVATLSDVDELADWTASLERLRNRQKKPY